MTWDVDLNDKIGDCVLAAFAHAQQIWSGVGPTDAEVQAVFDQWCDPVSGCPIPSTFQRAFLAKWIGCFGKITAAELQAALDNFGCAFAAVRSLDGTPMDHSVLVLSPTKCVSWGAVHDLAPTDIKQLYAISPSWSWQVAWWQVRNEWTWWLAIPFAAVLVAKIGGLI